MLNHISSFHILGGTGFIGRHLCKILLRETDSSIRLFSRSRKASLSEPVKSTEIVYGDMLSEESVQEFITRNAVVVNLAHIRSENTDANLVAAKNLANACINKRAKRLIHCSSATVVGNTKEDIVTEETECRPTSEYESNKLMVERLLIDKLRGKVELAILRPTAVFGRGGKNLVKTANELARGSRFTNTLKASIFYRRRLNLVCVENVVAGLIFLSSTGSTCNGELFIISDDEDPRNNYYDVARLLSYHLDLSHIQFFQIPFQNILLSLLLRMVGRSNVNPNRIYNSDKLFKSGFKKALDFQEGIEGFASWYENEILRNSRIIA